MQKFIRVILFMLVTSLIISCIACGGSPGGKDEGGKDSGVIEKGLPDKLKDPNIKVIFWAQPNEDNLELISDFEKKYGGKVNYQITTWGELEGKIISSIASGDAPDMIYISQNDFIRRVTKDMLLPIDDYFDLDDPIWNKIISEKFRWGGKLYCPVQSASSDFIFFNQTMFENNGVKTPLEYFKEGNWTFENFRKVAMELTQDTDRDGNPDQWGYASWKYDLFVLANNGKFIDLTDDGNISLAMDNENTMYALQFMQDGYYKDKYIMPDGNVQWAEGFTSGKIAMIAEAAYIAEWYLSGKMKDEWDVVPFPSGPANPDRLSTMNAGGWTLLNGGKNPRGAAAYLTLAAQKAKEKGIKPMLKHYTQAQAERIIEARKNGIVSFHGGIGNWGNMQWNFWGEIFAGEPVSTTIEKHKPLFQREIDLTLADK